MRRRPTRAWQRALACALAGVVTLTTCPLPPVFAQPLTSTPSQGAQSASLNLAQLDLSTLSVPKTLGQIVDTWQPQDQPPEALIIYLQDLHAQPDAQRALSELVGYLHHEFGVSLVALEGAEGLCDTALYSDFPDPPSTERIARLFLQEGLFTGAEYYAITHPHDVTLWGVEDAPLYLEHVQTYQQQAAQHADAEATLAQLRDLLGPLRATVYPPTLQKLLQLRDAEERDEEGAFQPYFTELWRVTKAAKLDLATYPHLEALARAYELHDQLDTRVIGEERTRLAKALWPSLNAAEREHLGALAKAANAKQASSEPYDERLGQITRARGIVLSADYPAFDRYLIYLAQSKQIRLRELTDELETLEEAVGQAYLATDEQRALARLLKQTQLLDELLHVKLSPTHFRDYQQGRSSLTADSLWQDLHRVTSNQQPATSNKLSVTKGQLEQLVAALPIRERFYDLALKRNDALVRNTLTLLKQPATSNQQPVTVLITGGFHTPGVTEQLKAHHIAYVVVTPRYAGKLDDSLYRERLRSEIPSLDALVKKLDAEALPPPLATGTTPVFAPESGPPPPQQRPPSEPEQKRLSKHDAVFRTFLALKIHLTKGIEWLKTWIQAHPEEARLYGIAVALVAGKIILSAMGSDLQFNATDGTGLAMAGGAVMGSLKDVSPKSRGDKTAPTRTRTRRAPISRGPSVIIESPLEEHDQIVPLIQRRVQVLGGRRLLILNLDSHSDYALGESSRLHIGNWGSYIERIGLGRMIWFGADRRGGGESDPLIGYWNRRPDIRADLLRRVTEAIRSGEFAEVWLTIDADSFSLQEPDDPDGEMFYPPIVKLFERSPDEIIAELRRLRDALDEAGVSVARIVPAISRPFLARETTAEQDAFIDSLQQMIRQVFVEEPRPGSPGASGTGSITPPRVGSTEGHVNEAILQAADRLQAGTVNPQEAALEILAALRTWTEPEHLVNLSTARDILHAAEQQQPDPLRATVLTLLESYATTTDHTTLPYELQQAFASSGTVLAMAGVGGMGNKERARSESDAMAELVGGKENLAYLERIRDIVNPPQAGTRKKTVALYVASGADISTALLATDADEVYMVERHHFLPSADLSDEALKKYAIKYLLQKEGEGFAQTDLLDRVGGLWPFLHLELGILDAQDIRLTPSADDPRVVIVTFTWNDRPRRITFLGRTDASEVDSYAKYVQDGIDFFIMKSGEGLSGTREGSQLIETVAKQFLNRDGFCILDSPIRFPSKAGSALLEPRDDGRLHELESAGARFGYLTSAGHFSPPVHLFRKKADRAFTEPPTRPPGPSPGARPKGTLSEVAGPPAASKAPIDRDQGQTQQVDSAVRVEDKLKRNP